MSAKFCTIRQILRRSGLCVGARLRRWRACAGIPRPAWVAVHIKRKT